jgi:hypothetical protein
VSAKITITFNIIISVVKKNFIGNSIMILQKYASTKVFKQDYLVLNTSYLC